jgi:excisionase family DNA binding protein
MPNITDAPACAPDNFLTTEEAAHLLRTIPFTIRQWAKGKLKPAVRRVGRRILFDRAVLMRLLEGGGK